MLSPEKAAEVVALEAAFSAAHKGGNGYAFASAPLAISALLDLLDSGDRIVVSDGLKAGVYRIIEGVRRRSAGLKIDFVDMSDVSALERAAEEEVRLIWVELLAGPRLSRPDLGAIAALAKTRSIFAAADVSALGHGAVRPLEDGFHIVFSDAPGRSIACCEGQRAPRGGLVSFVPDVGFAEDRFAFLQAAYDSLPHPDQAAAMLDSLKRLAAEMAARSTSARGLATLLKGRHFISELVDPGQDVGELSVTIKGGAADVAARLAALKHFAPADVPGRPGTHWHYAQRGHEAVPEEIRQALGIPDGIVRFGVPAKEPALLAADFEAAFGRGDVS